MLVALLALRLLALQSPTNLHVPRNMWLKFPMAVLGHQLVNPRKVLLGWSVRGDGTSALPETPPLIFLIEAH